MACYKLYYPEAFYSTILKYRVIPAEIERDPDMLDPVIMHMEENKKLTSKETDVLRILYLLAEARDRGCDIKKLISEAG